MKIFFLAKNRILSKLAQITSRANKLGFEMRVEHRDNIFVKRGIRTITIAYMGLMGNCSIYNYNVLMEGLAKYHEKQIIPDKKKWVEDYDNVSQEILKIINQMDVIEEFISKMEDNTYEDLYDLNVHLNEIGNLICVLTDSLNNLTYTLGNHMVYTISFYPEELVKLKNLKPKEFINIYNDIFNKKFSHEKRLPLFDLKGNARWSNIILKKSIKNNFERIKKVLESKIIFWH